MILTPEMVAAAWAKWRERHPFLRMGPGPAFQEAVAAAIAAAPSAMLRELLEARGLRLVQVPQVGHGPDIPVTIAEGPEPTYLVDPDQARRPRPPVMVPAAALQSSIEAIGRVLHAIPDSFAMSDAMPVDELMHAATTLQTLARGEPLNPPIQDRGSPNDRDTPRAYEEAQDRLEARDSR